MLTESHRQHVARATRTMQFIVGGIFAGGAGFLGIVLIIRNAAPNNEGTTSYMALAMAVISVLLALVLPPFISSAHLGAKVRSLDNAASDSMDYLTPLLILYQTRLIIRVAILDGAVFFCLIAYLIEGHHTTLITAAALLALMLLQMPTAGRVQSWLTREVETKEQLRHLS